MSTEGKFKDREIYLYHPVDEGEPAKPEVVRFYMPKRRDWAEINNRTLLESGVTAADLPTDEELDAIETLTDNLLPKRFDFTKQNYAIVESYVHPEDIHLLDDLSPKDCDAILDALRPGSAGLNEEQEKNSSSHLGQPKIALNAPDAIKSCAGIEDVKVQEGKAGP